MRVNWQTYRVPTRGFRAYYERYRPWQSEKFIIQFQFWIGLRVWNIWFGGKPG